MIESMRMSPNEPQPFYLIFVVCLLASTAATILDPVTGAKAQNFFQKLRSKLPKPPSKEAGPTKPNASNQLGAHIFLGSGPCCILCDKVSTQVYPQSLVTTCDQQPKHLADCRKCRSMVQPCSSAILSWVLSTCVPWWPSAGHSSSCALEEARCCFHR